MSNKFKLMAAARGNRQTETKAQNKYMTISYLVNVHIIDL